MEHRPFISISRQDWSLHRKGPVDQARHNEKVKEAIRHNLPEIVSEESIITSDGNSIVKVPIRSLELPRFRFDDSDQEQIGQGSGGSQVGDVIGSAPGRKPGSGKKAGEEAGIDYYEAEITVDELADLIFADLKLPNLQPKRQQEVESETVRFNEIRKSGPMSNLEKRRTILQNIRRNALAGNPAFGSIKNDDLRYRTWERDIKRETNAVIIAMRDVSGSMGEFEKYISRSIYFWMVRFLRRKYASVKIVFLTHHTEAKEVDEQTFFNLGESGGTKVSSVYRLAQQIMNERYNPDDWNVYLFHFSDGDNWGDSDNRQCLELAGKLLEKASLFGYGEIQETRYSTSTLMTVFGAISNPKFVPVIIPDKTAVFTALQKFFGKESFAAEAGSR